RRWVIQWLLNPNVYHPRTRMPVTFLTPAQAADVAEWLLSQKVTDWKERGPAKPTREELVRLARVYLAKAPGFTSQDVNDVLPLEGKGKPVSEEKLKAMPRDADERKLGEGVGEDELKWYIGRKAVGRQGCFGCHDIPGFETAKPIGTGLND